MTSNEIYTAEAYLRYVLSICSQSTLNIPVEGYPEMVTAMTEIAAASDDDVITKEELDDSLAKYNEAL